MGVFPAQVREPLLVVDYNFVTRLAMETMIAEGQFLESAEFGGNFYGTSKQAVEVAISFLGF